MISFKNRSNRPIHQSSDICLTPLIDVALTLLVIFMISSPMKQNSLKIELPTGQAQEAGKQDSDEMIVGIDKHQMIYFQAHVQKDINELIQSIKAYSATTAKKRVWIMIDKDESCSAAMLLSVIDSIKVMGGIKDVAIATQKPTTAV